MRIIATSGLGFFQALAAARRQTQASQDMSKVGPLLWPDARPAQQGLDIGMSGP